MDGKTKVSFSDLGLSEMIISACENLNWRMPTEIQAAVIPHALAGRNLIGLAETGSGKTAAYALPILQSLINEPKNYFALILAPTRELAAQVQAQFAALGKLIGLRTSLLVGGSPIAEQANQLNMRPPHIIIATPGRFTDHLKRTKGFDEIKLQNLRFLVIDEADRMLGSDFDSVLEKVLVVLPTKRQTFLFSATMTEKVGKLQRASLRDPIKISTRKSKFQSVAGLRQFVQLVPQADLDAYLVFLLRIAFCITPPIDGLETLRLSEPSDQSHENSESQVESTGSAIVFTRTRDASNRLSLLLRQFLSVPVVTLNGDMPQAQRLGALAKFKRVPMSVLVATDVASRGLDIPQVGLVVNYDVPLDAKTYMHRVGRTARAGREGCALTLLTQFSAVFYLKEIESHLLTTSGAAQEKVPTLIAPYSATDVAAEAAVQELSQEVKVAMVLARKTVEGLQKRNKGSRAPGAFVSVDDVKTPSTNEVVVPTGTKRTGWASEASAEAKRSIAEVLAATSVGENVAAEETAAAEASKRMSSRSKKRRPGFKRAYQHRHDERKAAASRDRSSFPLKKSSTSGKRKKFKRL
uniref:RNA helicase n=2 Tax=Schistocephalus solidus TaxID=70667 RepID=A0A0V0J6R3_SCHSO